MGPISGAVLLRGRDQRTYWGVATIRSRSKMLVLRHMHYRSLQTSGTMTWPDSPARDGLFPSRVENPGRTFGMTWVLSLFEPVWTCSTSPHPIFVKWRHIKNRWCHISSTHLHNIFWITHHPAIITIVYHNIPHCATISHHVHILVTYPPYFHPANPFWGSWSQAEKAEKSALQMRPIG